MGRRGAVPNRVVREGLVGKGACPRGLKEVRGLSPADIGYRGKECSSRGDHQCRGPLLIIRNSKEARVAGVEGVGGGEWQE